VKYAELMVDWLVELGYTHCFFVAGGNNMHLLDGVRKRMTCVPFVHEVAAGIAAEYFNEAGDQGRAFALVTAGPGMTNIVSALAGAFLESRELLVLGGQVKSTDLASDGVRQRGIQEVDGVSLAAPVAVLSELVSAPVDRERFMGFVTKGRTGRPGPVFIEVCLDAQGAPVERADFERAVATTTVGTAAEVSDDVRAIKQLMDNATRPVWLIGGGVSRETAAKVLPQLRKLRVPVMTTWNGMDRIDAAEEFYLGRPNTWGQRYSNILIQQADLVVAFGTRLGLQQTGFNWQQFVPVGKVVQIDIDEAELRKGHPRVDLPIHADANSVLTALAAEEFPSFGSWLSFCQKVKGLVPLQDPANITAAGYVDPYAFVEELSPRCEATDVIIPCSSGGAFTVPMQCFNQRAGQIVVTDKGLASMGYGLSGAIGASLANPSRRTLLLEGDGGFSQNLQELATVSVNRLPLKIFVFANEGYASIRMTQRNYFDGQYLGCDTATGLGFPHWPTLFAAYGIEAIELDADEPFSATFEQAFQSDRPVGFVVPVDPEQTYFPKITSRVTETGGMESMPLHLMSPDLPEGVAREVFAYL
jgi:acetolactate synthase I/II/III large subunit